MRCSNSQVRWKRRRTSSFPASSRSGRRTRWTEPGRCSCWTAYRWATLARSTHRRSVALGAVVLCEGCADPFSPKVVRSTMGAVFRLPCVTLPLAEAAERLHRNGLPLYATALHEDSVPLSRFHFPAAVIIGSEGKGVTEQALRLSDRRVIIP
ncbi:MAG: TrmH family RNA methyltransferase [Butyricicoccaceae bacterium]